MHRLFRHQNVASRLKPGGEFREESPQAPFAAIARHGVAYFFAGRITDPAYSRFREEEKDERLGVRVSSLSVDPLKLAIEFQSRKSV
jgi:hypothetical protein